MTDRSSLPDGVVPVRPDAPDRFAFSICTLMTRPEQYAAMVASYRAAGFGDDCEYLCIDNSAGNVFDAYSGYNAFLVEAQGRYVILTHQDVELRHDRRAELEARIAELTALDPAWGVCGNSGGVELGVHAIRISDPHGADQALGPFPRRVQALDENFLCVPRHANLCLSSDLSGYHMYGPDLCVMADIQGRRSYVIDFHLVHLSGGTRDDSFDWSAAAFTRKYARAFRARWIQAPVTSVYLTSHALAHAVATSRLARRLRRLRGRLR